jgi:hypothetical protein
MTIQETIIDLLLSAEPEILFEKILCNKDSRERLIEMLIEAGEINKGSVRNFMIRRRFNQLHIGEGIKVEEAFITISNEFESITPDTVKNIIYAAKK